MCEGLKMKRWGEYVVALWRGEIKELLCLGVHSGGEDIAAVALNAAVASLDRRVVGLFIGRGVEVIHSGILF